MLRDGAEVYLGGRAFDLLLVLLASQGRVVCKQQIMRQVWPTTTVDESNLRFQISELRKALGNARDLIKTIPGRGYLLAMDIDEARFASPSATGAADMLSPAQLGHRREVGDAICALLRALNRYPDAAVPLEALLSGVSGQPLSEMSIDDATSRLFVIGSRDGQMH